MRAEVAKLHVELPASVAGANVQLAVPTDDIVLEGCQSDQGVSYAAPTQVAVDLLTGPGRSPAESASLRKIVTCRLSPQG